MRRKESSRRGSRAMSSLRWFVAFSRPRRFQGRLRNAVGFAHRPEIRADGDAIGDGRRGFGMGRQDVPVDTFGGFLALLRFRLGPRARTYEERTCGWE